MKKPTPVILKSPYKPIPDALGFLWHRCSVRFKDDITCRTFSMPLAIQAQRECSHIYFARYMNALEARTDFYFGIQTLGLPPKRIEDRAARTRTALSAYGKNTFKATPLAFCDGSLPHALGGYLAMAIYKQHLAHAPDEESDEEHGAAAAFKLMADVEHWTSNMLNLDYCDEARLQLYGLGRIISIFEHSIQEGRKLTREMKKPKTVSRN